MGRLAEAEGESQIYRDLRMKLFINPDTLEGDLRHESRLAQEAHERLRRRAQLLPRDASAASRRASSRTSSRGWRSSFTEGSIGGDIEKVNLNQLEAFYGTATRPREHVRRRRRGAVQGADAARTASPSRRRTRVNHHALLLINPHTSFFFRSEAADDERRRAQRVRRRDVGAVLHLPGLQPARRLDAHVERRRRGRRIPRDGHEEGRRLRLQARRRGAARRLRRKITVPYKTASGMATKDFTVYYTQHGPVVREAERQVGRRRADERAGARR